MAKSKKCNCGKKATSEYVIEHKDYVSCISFCDGCEPKQLGTWGTQGMTKIR